MEDNIDNQSEDNKNIIKDPSKNNNLKRPLKDMQGNRRNTYPSKAFKFKISSTLLFKFIFAFALLLIPITFLIYSSLV